MAKRYQLAGISFPFRSEGRGLPAGAKGMDVIRSCIIWLFKTPTRSRVMRPTLGHNLYSIIFENTGPIMRSMLMREITVSVANELPMVKINYIDIQENDKVVTVNIFYSAQGIEDSTGVMEFEKGGQK